MVLGKLIKPSTFTNVDSIDSEKQKQVKMLLWSVFAGSRGCINRAKIVSRLQNGSRNTNQLSEELGLDYKVVQRHINILVKNNLLHTIGDKYGMSYFLSPKLESNMHVFDEMVEKSNNCK